MAKKFIDAGIKDAKESWELGDGTALDLTGKVRILYDDTMESKALYVLISRVRDRILEGSAPDAD